MSTEGANRKQTLIAAADYSAAGTDYKAVRIDTSAAYTALVNATLGARVDGIMSNHPASGSRSSSMRTAGPRRDAVRRSHPPDSSSPPTRRGG